jgi:hypothetical protein
MPLFGPLRSPSDNRLHPSRSLPNLECSAALPRTGHPATSLRELNFQDRKQLHNFKYFTWVEQQQRSADDLRKLWDPQFWDETFGQVGEWDRMIEDFNKRVAAV